MDQFRPSKVLRHTILKTIVAEEQHNARKYVTMSFVVGLVSIVGMTLSIRNVVELAYQSSLYQYISLIFSDPDIVVSYWKDFVFSVIESVPFFGLTITLAAIALLMISLKLFISNKGRNFSFSFNN